MKTPQEIYGIHKATGHDVTAPAANLWRLKYPENGTLITKKEGSRALCEMEKQRLIRFYQHKKHLFQWEAI